MSQTLRIKCDARSTHLHVRAEGPYDAEQARHQLSVIAREAWAHALDRVLIDATGVDEPKDAFERYNMGLAFAQLRFSRLRIASVYRSFRPHPTLAEDTAVNRGVSFRVFSNESEALGWLLAGCPTPLDPTQPSPPGDWPQAASDADDRIGLSR
jgi:hypothetical protein